MTEIVQPIPARLKNVAVGGHVAGAEDIIDDTLNKDQATINSEVQEALGTGGSVDEKIASAVDAAKAEIKGNATSACDTLGEAEALISAETSARQSAISNVIGNAASDYNTLGKLEDKIQAEATRAEAAESALSSGKADKATTLAGYGITDAYTKSETYTKTEVNGLVDTPHQEYVTVSATSQTTDVTDLLPAEGSADTIYRVSNWDGSSNSGAGAFDVTVYSEYAWDDVSDPKKYIFLCVKTQIGEVFDISVYNNNAKYADLSAALGTNGANVPADIRRGGMRIQFVQSSDNKYVQYRLTAQSFSTTVTDWEGMDDFVSTAQQSFSDAKKQQARENIEAMFAGCDPVISEAFAMIWNELQGVRGLLFDSGYNRPSFFVKKLDAEEMSVCGFPLVLTCDVAGAPAAARIPSNWDEDSMGFWTGVPMFEGQRYHDRVSKKVYEAVNVTNSTNDWVLLN